MIHRLFVVSAVSLLLAACAAPAGSIGGTDYAPQYDFSEFYAATNGRTFRVLFEGNPFPALSPEESRRRLLPVMQANRPRPRLTFTDEIPAELPRPDYRLVLVFDSAIDLTAQRVCAGEVRHRPAPVDAAGRFAVFAVYCRNDLALSQSTAWTPATGPDDPRVGRLFSELFLVLFTDSPMVNRRSFPAYPRF